MLTGKVKEKWTNVRPFKNASIRQVRSIRDIMRHFSLGCPPLVSALRQRIQITS